MEHSRSRRDVQVSLNKICKISFCAVVLMSCFWGLPIYAAPLNDDSEIMRFLAGADVPAAQAALIAERYTEGRPAVVMDDDMIFSFAVHSAPIDSDKDVQEASDRLRRDIAASKARRAIAAALLAPRMDRERYRYEDALIDAIAAEYDIALPTGIQSVSSIIDDGGRIVAVLIWGAADGCATAAPQEEEKLEDMYCRVLRQRYSRQKMSSGQYEEALGMLKNIHDLGRRDPAMLLDIAECFMRTGRADECAKMLDVLWTSARANINDMELERLGDLLSESGDRDRAQAAYKAARERYKK